MAQPKEHPQSRVEQKRRGTHCRSSHGCRQTRHQRPIVPGGSTSPTRQPQCLPHSAPLEAQTWVRHLHPTRPLHSRAGRGKTHVHPTHQLPCAPPLTSWGPPPHSEPHRSSPRSRRLRGGRRPEDRGMLAAGTDTRSSQRYLNAYPHPRNTRVVCLIPPQCLTFKRSQEGEGDSKSYGTCLTESNWFNPAPYILHDHHHMCPTISPHTNI